jgi:4-amino-4-deoxy-L-arabinose transferase-like glycosyltransferase
MKFALKKHHQVLLLVTCLGLFLRIYALGENPVALNQDEAVNGYDAYALGMTLRDHHGNFLPVMMESFGDWASPLLTYVTVPFVRILGLSEFSTRLPAALLGVGSIPLIYVLAYQLFAERWLALLSAFLLAIMPWSITLSRFAIPPSAITFFLLLFLISFCSLINKLQNYSTSVSHKINNGIALSTIATSITAALLTYSYPTQKVFVPLFLLGGVIVFLGRSHRIRGFYIFGSYLLMVLPLYLPSLLDPEKYNKRFQEVSILKPGQNVVLGFIFRYTSNFLPDNIFGRGDRILIQRVPHFGNVYDFLSILFYLGCLVCLWAIWQRESFVHLKRSSAMLLGLWLVLFPIPSSLTKDYYHTLRGLHGFPLVVLMIVLGVWIIHQEIKHKQIRQCLIGILLFLCFANTISFGMLYFTAYPALSKIGFQFGIKPAMSYMIAHEQDYKKVVVDTGINQPYIYVLFYTQFDPRRLSSTEIDSYSDEEGWVRFRKLDKYEFRSISTEEVAKYQLVYQVADDKPNPGFRLPKVWFNLYRDQNQTLFVQKVKPM